MIQFLGSKRRLLTLEGMWLQGLGLALLSSLSLPVLSQSPANDTGDTSGKLPSGTEPTWSEKYGPQHDLTYAGPLSFAHLPYHRCLEKPDVAFDIAILGMPFDTAVSHRPGARFGPTAIRSGSRRQHHLFGYTMAWGMNPYSQGQEVVDCGDVPVKQSDNKIAIDQMEVAYSTLLRRHNSIPLRAVGGDNALGHPRIITLGGDHTIVLPILRSLFKVYGPVSVIHFDAHLDTWPPNDITGPGESQQSRITHGTFFYIAHEEGLLANNSIHGGIRTPLKEKGTEDLDNDAKVGFQVITSDDIDDLGTAEIIKRMRDRIGSSPVYLSLDIDVIDPGMAPGTGTPEVGGWTTREVKRILRGLKGLNFIGADVVEVAPAYDNAEITAIAGASIVSDLVSLLVIAKTSEAKKKNTFLAQPSEDL